MAEDALASLIDIITVPNSLDQASLARIVRHLYPASKVRDEVVTIVVASLGQGSGKAGSPVQVALLKWLILIYDVLEDRDFLARLYAVLFNLLDTLSIR